MQVAKVPPDAELLAAIARSLQLGPLESLGGFESHLYRWREGSRSRILRLTHAAHRDRRMIEAELGFIRFLHGRGAPVCAVLSRQGSRTHVFGSFTASLFSEAPGKSPGQQQWGPGLFRAWGCALGVFHRLTVDYVPAQGLERFAWRDDANLCLAARIPQALAVVRQRAREALAALERLPTTHDLFGLVHNDAHASNLHIDHAGHLTFFDFDDCCYQWFGYDLATVLFSAVLQPWVPDSPRARDQAAHDFLGPFLEGYAQEHPLPAFVFDTLPLFLKVRELCLFGVVHAFFDVEQLDHGYAARFMAGRRARIEADEPYLGLDFRALA